MQYDKTLASLVTDARRFGDKIAIVAGEHEISFSALDDRVGRLATSLAARGITRGDVVSLHGASSWEWVVAYHAIMRVGAVINPINALLAPDEVAFILSDCKAKLLIADQSRLDKLGDLAIDSVSLDAVDELSKSGACLLPSLALPKDLSTICYTSGTTGRPKGAMLTHRNVVMNVALTGLMQGRVADDVTVTALPLAHVYGNVVMNASLMTGATLVLLSKFEAATVFMTIETYRATRFDGVPTMYYYLLEHLGVASADLSSLRSCTVGGQTMPCEKMQAVESAFGCPLIELWGMSEIAGLGTTFPATGPRTLGSIGIPLPLVSIRTVHLATRAPITDTTPGELQIRGPIVMRGYLNNPDATKAVLDASGWLSTGDIARIDEAGQIFIVDRASDVILTSGNNVYPAEIERVIALHAGVAMVAVGRDRHVHKGEVPHAYVVLRSGFDVSEDAIIAHCRDHLAPYKLPRAVSFVGDLPKNSTGKILRRALVNNS